MAADVATRTLDVGDGMSDALSYGLDLYAKTLRGGGKRVFDIVLSLLLLILSAPIIVFAMLAIWLGSLGREPVIYRQVRVGLNGKLITLLKLRTMRVDAEPSGPRMAVCDDPRVTRLGRILRRSRIDVLPQLFNVLRGDMSLIGPRPERPEFVAQFEQEIEGYGLRHRVKPGITGLAQVRYSYAESLEDTVVKLYYDLQYVRNCSLKSDILILLRTMPVVVTGWGAR
jgi:lipopolysaccharide/colanic/teichoic acid biosynthesis glycosyltransferase